MIRRHHLRAASVGAVLAAAVANPAAAFLARNDLVVEPAGDGSTFAVPYRGKSAVQDFWCAAGDYVLRGLNMPRSTRIYRVSEPPRRSGEGITFSLDPARSASRTGLAILGGGDGASLSIAHAQLLCDRGRLFDVF